MDLGEKLNYMDADYPSKIIFLKVLHAFVHFLHLAILCICDYSMNTLADYSILLKQWW